MSLRLYAIQIRRLGLSPWILVIILLYQIFTYVKNQDKGSTGDVAGILLYAKTDEAITPDCMYNMGGNLIGAKTLGLNADFNVIAAQLDKISEDFLKII